jgi:hypothetical protein
MFETFAYPNPLSGRTSTGLLEIAMAAPFRRWLNVSLERLDSRPVSPSLRAAARLAPQKAYS